jgi:hypothetical protein
LVRDSTNDHIAGVLEPPQAPLPFDSTLLLLVLPPAFFFGLSFEFMLPLPLLLFSVTLPFPEPGGGLICLFLPPTEPSLHPSDRLLEIVKPVLGYKARTSVSDPFFGLGQRLPDDSLVVGHDRAFQIPRSTRGKVLAPDGDYRPRHEDDLGMNSGQMEHFDLVI